MARHSGREELAPGIVRLAAPGTEGVTINVYLVGGGGSYCLVGAGTAASAPVAADLCRGLVAPHEVGSLVLLDEGPLEASGLAAWRREGFAGEVLAPAGAAGALAAAGSGPLRAIPAGATAILQGTALEMAILWPEGGFGEPALLHRTSACLFTGRFASSVGADLPSPWTEAGLGPQLTCLRGLGAGALPPEGLDDLAPAWVCPRLGSVLPGSLAAAAGRLAREAPGGPGEAARLATELSALRTSNYALKESMVLASDSALRDTASGLYGRAYAEAFIKDVIGRGTNFSAAFIRIDAIKELNRKIGPRAVDDLMRDLAYVIQEGEPSGFLFRWIGPVILLVLEGEEVGLFERLKRLLDAVAKEKRFVAPITVSVALVRSAELGEDSYPTLQAHARERLKLLDRRGGNDILDRSDIQVEDRSLVLALDADGLFLDFLVTSLEREGFRTLGSIRGGEALELMDKVKPELVIVDANLPQFDAFQIRLRTRGSNDLHDIPFILLCSSKSDDVVARAHGLGMYHILQKPVSMVELIGIAKSLLARSDNGA